MFEPSRCPAGARLRRIVTTIFIALCFVVISTLLVTNAIGQTAYILQSPTAHIVWSKQPGVSRYRLQIASDARFTDVLYDGLVTGHDYVVRDLAPGKYFWRVARAQQETGPFLGAVPFEVKVADRNAVARTRVVPGWTVATGLIVHLMPAPLRSATHDFLAVNTEGNVYALDGERGIALWASSYNLSGGPEGRQRGRTPQFAPLFVKSTGRNPSVVVGFDKGVRALDGVTGRELWKTTVTGRPFAGTLLTSNNGLTSKLFLIGENAQKIFIIDSRTGELESEQTLSDEAIGPPVIVSEMPKHEMLTPLKGGIIDIRLVDGTSIRSLKLGTEITTQPIIVRTRNNLILLVGTKIDVAAFNAKTLQSLGRIALDDNQYPVGTLQAVDLDNDGSKEVVIVTNGGRIVSAGVDEGKIRWSTSILSDVSVPALADIDGDGKLDVVVSTRERFAIALSGANGGEIWNSGEELLGATRAVPGARLVAVTIAPDFTMIIAGSEFSAGLRAMAIPKSTASVNR